MEQITVSKNHHRYHLHPSIHLLYLLYLYCGRKGLLELIPAVKGQEAGYNVDR